MPAAGDGAGPRRRRRQRVRGPGAGPRLRGGTTRRGTRRLARLSERARGGASGRVPPPVPALVFVDRDGAAAGGAGGAILVVFQGVVDEGARREQVFPTRGAQVIHEFI